MPESSRPSHAGSRGPLPAHTAEEVTEVAVALADRSGLAATTVRAVAVELGTAPAALYRYIASRDDLLERMVDRALADLTPPTPTGSPVADLVALTTAQIEVLRRHPWLVDTLQAVPPGPNTMRALDLGLAILAEVPADGARKLETLAMLTGVATLFARASADVDQRTITAITAAAPSHPHLAAAIAAPGSAAPRQQLIDRTVAALAGGLLGLERTV